MEELMPKIIDALKVSELEFSRLAKPREQVSPDNLKYLIGTLKSLLSRLSSQGEKK